MGKLSSLTKRLHKELQVYRLVLKDKRTPLLAKILLGITITYALSPIDIIPDVIPVLGYLDDAIILPLLLTVALWLIPTKVIEECRENIKKLDSK